MNEEIKRLANQLIPLLGYNQDNGKWRKQYKGNCTIEIDMETGKIAYPNQICSGDRTTANFHAEENLIVLECVDRLLSKGYPANKIELERRWRVGRGNEGGKTDILVRHGESNEIYLMIECKTYPDKFETEKQKMLKDGGQLFSYWLQDKAAKILCLYSSWVGDGQVRYVTENVFVNDSLRNGSNLEEVHTRWDKQFSQKGVFEPDIQVYNIKLKPLKYRDLKSLGEDDGKRIFHQFLEILRHNVVSDKGNAFNKIFNLFLCKIFDEDRGEDDDLEFQWIEGEDDPYTLMDRLNNLYKEGMREYLYKDITDYSASHIRRINDRDIERMMTELRLYKNQEFAFVDVYNEDSFKRNTEILKEIVKLLQGWKIRYNEKQQFLGEFFELLLNSGFKQESGQFFTPVPLVRFIIKSLPVEEIIDTKIDDRNTEFLPHVIDFACGSGHFLTEAMDILRNYIKEISSATSRLTPLQKRKLRGYIADEFGWAKEYIYGIERDYRLAKTTKLATFLNGDGEACIINASGIDPFDKYNANMLKPNKFDILIANPPYAVKGFKNTVLDGENSFKLFDSLTDKTGDIEILFMERAGQLLKPGGVAGIILPQSFLNGSNYGKIRKMMFEQFEVKALVILGASAFMATGIKTTILFLKKREQKIKLEEKEQWKRVERERILVVNGDIKDKHAEAKFLGYDFSNRRGQEGIKRLTESSLLNEDNFEDCNYINSHILRTFAGTKNIKIPERLRDKVASMKLGDIIDDQDENRGLVFLDFERLRCSDQSVELEPIGSVLSVCQSGKRPPGGVGHIENGVWSLGGEHIDEDLGTIKKERMRYITRDYFEEKIKFESRVIDNDILLNKDGELTGKVALFDVGGEQKEVAINEHLFRIRTNPEECLQRFMFFYMMTKFFRKQSRVFSHRKKGAPGLKRENLERILFPRLSIAKQKEFVDIIDKKWNYLTGKGERTSFIDDEFSKIGLLYARIDDE